MVPEKHGGASTTTKGGRGGGRRVSVFLAFFARAFQRLPQHHPNAHGDLDDATWVLLRLDVSQELAHYRASVIQSVGISLSVVMLGLAAFWFFGMMQRYLLASGEYGNPASIHVAGRRALEVIATARSDVARLLNTDATATARL